MCAFTLLPGVFLISGCFTVYTGVAPSNTPIHGNDTYQLLDDNVASGSIYCPYILYFPLPFFWDTWSDTDERWAIETQGGDNDPAAIHPFLTIGNTKFYWRKDMGKAATKKALRDTQADALIEVTERYTILGIGYFGVYSTTVEGRPIRIERDGE